MYNLTFYSSIKKDVKGLDKPVQKMLKEKIFPTIAGNPEVGEELAGDLSGYRAYHFEFGRVQYRVAYAIQR